MRTYKILLIAGLMMVMAITAVSGDHNAAWARSQPVAEKQAAADKYGDDYAAVSESDPFEPVNRVVYGFNKVLDIIFLKPLAKGYRFIVPQWGRNRVSSVLRNLGEPINFLNALLQGDVDHSFNTLWRFVINTTWGVGGAFDIAGMEGLRYRQEDFGQTLGRYGVGTGPYLMLPIFGPSNLRDAGGLVVDTFTNPFHYIEDDELLITYKVVQAIAVREGILDYMHDVETTSLDPYATYRSIYLQNRQRAVRDRGNGNFNH